MDLRSYARTGKKSFLAISILAFPLATSAQTFEIVDLGTFGGADSGAHAISSNNAVVGWAHSAAQQRTPFLHDETGPMLSLGFLPYGSHGTATAVSSNGQYVAGHGGITFSFSTDPPVLGTEVTQGFFWHDGKMHEIGAFYNPAFFNRRHGYSEAHGVNDYGQVVGFSMILRAAALHAFLWQNGVLVDLTPLLSDGSPDPSHTRAFGINNNEEIVGEFAQFDLDTGVLHPPYAVRWQNRALHRLAELPGHTHSSARAINEYAEVAGWSGTGEWSHAVLWQGGTIRSLGMLPGDESSRALGINDHGHITGWSGSLDQGSSRAFLWHCENMLDLNALIPAEAGWTLIEARDITNEGRIVGMGLKEGNLRAFMLEPAQDLGQCPDPGNGSGEGPGHSPGQGGNQGQRPEEHPGQGPARNRGQGQGPGQNMGRGVWPFAVSGAAPDRALGLGVNNIGLLNPADQIIYSCVKIHSNGSPAALDGLAEIEIALEMLDVNEGLVRVARSRAFNTARLTDAQGELPHCSGVYDTATGRYSDIIMYQGQTLQLRFELVNEQRLELKLVQLHEL